MGARSRVTSRMERYPAMWMERIKREWLSAFAGAMALAPGRGAVAGLGEFAVGTDAGLGVHAPVEALVGGLNRGIRFRQNELALPAQRGAEVGVGNVEAIRAHKTSVAGCSSLVAHRSLRTTHFGVSRRSLSGLSRKNSGRLFGTAKAVPFREGFSNHSFRRATWLCTFNEMRLLYPFAPAAASRARLTATRARRIL